MKTLRFAAVAASGLAAATIGMAPAAVCAPEGPGNARDAIDSLQSQGYKVIVNKIGDAALDQARVVGVRPGRPITQRVNDTGGDTIEQVLYTTIYLDVK